MFEKFDFKAYGLEFILAKGYYKSIKVGCLNISDKNSGSQKVSVLVKNKTDKLVHRLTRMGYISEIDSSVRLRVGDTLIYYIQNN